MKDCDPTVKAIVKLDNMAFDEKVLKDLMTSDVHVQELKKEINMEFRSHPIITEDHFFQNDIYNKMFITMPPEVTKIQADIIYPAPKSHIDKYTAQVYHIISETPEMHFTYVRPLYVDKLPPVSWIYNVLDKKKEVELCKFSNEHFTLQQDYKVNSEDIETLHMLAIPYRRDLRTIRDLNESHLPMLKSIKEESYKAIQEHYGIQSTKIRALFHYYPTFYHLHVHFVHVSQATKAGAFLGKGQLLEDAIENIEMKGDYYQTKTIQVQIGENHEIYKILKDNKMI
ncbi:histidine triad protein member [Stylonychia lemnae]|uniref:Histidine triad protein member n=1 Tax=Stylonychia lemnae TaxID=5949 RepID=A0A078AAC1_STYLE|nr:histidine triad protein member [Stylonychia lemnae]|eukprot:CDW78537.1 histidine triad protein member [Stylonychia lemnae]